MADDDRQVRIVFYKARPRLDSDVWPEGLYPAALVGRQVDRKSGRPGDAKYVMAGGHPTLGKTISAPEGITHVAVYRLRSNMLPELERDGVLTPLRLARNARLAEPSHWVFFGRNIVGTLSTRDGHGRTASTNYLERVVRNGRPTIELVPIVRRNVLQVLMTKGQAKQGQLRLDAADADSLAGVSPGLLRAMRQVQREVGAGSIEIVWRPPETTGGRQEFGDRMKAFVRGVRESFDHDRRPRELERLRVDVVDEDAPRHVSTIDLLSDEIAVFRTVHLIPGTRHVDPDDVQDKIIDGYNEARGEIEDAVAGDA